MRVLQLIDSLRPGGAEKMAVNLANALLPYVEGSYLCCSRKEGLLKEDLKSEVKYLYLNKKSSLDIASLNRLRKYILDNQIDIVHAHSTSFFFAGLLKITNNKIKLFWHDHYGESEFLQKREFTILKIFSGLFDGIISVNKELKKWALHNLNCDNVVEINNFVKVSEEKFISEVDLKGVKTAFKIISVANLRPQKDHLNLIEAFEKIRTQQEVSLHLIGEDPGTAYSATVFAAIKRSSLSQQIFYYGAQSEIVHLLEQADLGVLASRSEGLPVALLEYGIVGLPVVCTKVGKCAEVVGEYGKVVEAQNPEALAKAISEYIFDRAKMKEDSQNFQKNVKTNYTPESIMEKLIQFFKGC